MSDIFIPPAVTTTNPSVAQVGVPGTVTNPPPEVAKLTSGTIINGVVIGQDDRGQLLIRTDSTTLTVSTKAQLPVGTEVTLQVRSSGAQIQVIIVRVDTQASQAPQPDGGQQASGSTIPRSSTTPVPVPLGGGVTSDQLSLGHTIKAVVQTSVPNLSVTGGAAPAIAALSQETLIPANLTGLTPGTVLQLRIVAVTAAAAAPQAPGGANPNPVAGQPAGQVVPGQTNFVPSNLVPANLLQANLVPTNLQQANLIHAGTPTVTPNQSGATPGPPGVGVTQPSPAVPAVGPGQATATGPPGQIAPHLSGVTTPSTSQAATPTGPAVAGSAAAAPANANLTLAQTVQTESLQGLTNQAQPTQAQPHGAQTTGSTISLGQTAPAVPGPAIPNQAGGGLNQPIVPAIAIPTAAEIVHSESGLRFPGIVTTITNTGQLVVQTPLGTMTLEAQATLPLGSRVMLELPAGTGALPPLALPADALGSPSTLTKIWPALDELVRTAQLLDSPLAASALAPQIIPHLGPKMASGILFFLTALNGGNLEAWLGTPVLHALERAGYRSLIGRLVRDFGQMTRFSETSTGDWRLLLIPFLADDHLQQMRLFLRRHGDQGGSGHDDRPEDATHFILEVELSRVGDMQLDGLVRPKRFDLILRTRRALPENMRNDIAAIFDDANQSAGYQGSIGFQASFNWHFMPIEQTTETSSSGLVV